MSPLNRHSRKSTHHSQPYVLRRIALYIMIGFIAFVGFTSLGTIVQSQMKLSSSMFKQWSQNLSKESLISVLSMEISNLSLYNEQRNIATPKTTNLLLEMVTTFNPSDPLSLIRRELPGLAYFDGQVVVAGQGVSYSDFPMESYTSIEEIMKDREVIVPEIEQPTEQADEPSRTTEGRAVVFIYHTHNTESWMPYLPTIRDPNLAHHPDVNITLVGQRLGQELNKRGIGAQVDTTNIAQQLREKGLDFTDSYQVSREVVQEVMATNKDIHFMFDLHRDAIRREKTTVEIDGENYARTFFVIGGRNQQYEKNLALAERFHSMLEEAYPGLSKGVFLKHDGHGEYNQSLSENNLLIEIGGVENTLEESYRTAEALAEVIADLYWEANDVDQVDQSFPVEGSKE